MTSVGERMVHSRPLDGKERLHGRIHASTFDVQRWAPGSSPGALVSAHAGEVPGPRAEDGEAPGWRRCARGRRTTALPRSVPGPPCRPHERDVAAVRI